MDENFLAVIEHNRELQIKAREINTRAGEAVFPIMGLAEWKQWLTSRLNGARRVAEIANMEVLYLPELDQEVINKILTENPDTVEALEQSFLVTYRSGCVPQIILEGDMTENNRWIELPDAGIKLPGGRQVEIKVVTSTGWSGSSYADTSIPALKEKVRNHFNKKVWENWEKPPMVIPNLAADCSFIPEIVTQEYGKCVVTGIPLIACGTVIAYRPWSSDPITWKYEWYRERKTAEENWNKAIAALVQYQSDERKKRALAAVIVPDPSQEDAVVPEIAEIEGGYGYVQAESWYYSGTTFSVQWHTDCEYAERKRTEAVAKLDEVKVEAIKKRKLQEAKTEAEAVKSKASELYYHSDNGRLEQALRDKLYGINYSYLPSELEELQSLTNEAKAICAQAEAAYVEIQRKREKRNKDVQIPPGLLGKKAFNGNDDRAYDFMQKVAALPTNRLDSHIVCNCGRARVQSHLIEVSGDSDFFMGADPNVVVFYVAEVHFCSKPQSDFSQDTSNSSSGSIGVLGEALLRAGVGRK
ncbi:MAG: hypothetical protein AUJ72_03390 [Candidatus Omnitrophica bacterium CG1_02_46_14]|nr:MAG: hypothetical protein AUJ72_03390 [Candidatus Omnitrophica bacterium CG1_02_46_14]